MGNSQSARRFPALKDARARDPCQEGHAKLFKVSCVANATDPNLAEGQGAIQEQDSLLLGTPWKSANIGANPAAPLSFAGLLGRRQAASIHFDAVVVRPVSFLSFAIG
jgi:hypothetical protein